MNYLSDSVFKTWFSISDPILGYFDLDLFLTSLSFLGGVIGLF